MRFFPAFSVLNAIGRSFDSMYFLSINDSGAKVQKSGVPFMPA